MARSANTVWEIRTTGSDTNGGGFVAGGAGTDWSQQASPQYSVTDAVTNGTTTITSASGAFGTDVVDNILYISGGTGAIVADWYQIKTRVSASNITVDRSTGLTAGTGATLKIGGALATINKWAVLHGASNKAYGKNDGTYTTTSTITLSVGVTPDNTTPYNSLIGYTTTRTDGGKITIRATTNSSITVISVTGNGWSLQNITTDGNNLATSIGIDMESSYSRVIRCKALNCTTAGIKGGVSSAFTHFIENEVTACTSAATAALWDVGQDNFASRNNIHDNACPGVLLSSSGVGIRNVIVNNSGASSDGIQCQWGTLLLNNTIYNNGRHGISNTSPFIIANDWKNNLIVNNGGYGIQGANAAGQPASYNIDGNAFYNNTSGNRNFMDDTTVVPINGVNPYINTLDVILSGDPFTNAAGGDFSLNNTAGAGAACRGAGSFGVVPGTVVFRGYLDMGAIQHQDSGGAAGMLYVPNMEGT